MANKPRAEDKKEEATRPFRFIGRNHLVNGQPLAKGAIVELTERQARNLGSAKFVPVTAGDDVIDAATKQADEIVKDAQRQAEEIIADARKQADEILATLK